MPHFLRTVDRALRRFTGKSLPVEAAPIRFGSWMGGDRDGNPNVIPGVTAEVCLLSRRTAIDLYLGDIAALRWELSMLQGSDELKDAVDGAREPYRVLLQRIHARLRATRCHLEAQMEGTTPVDGPIYTTSQELAEPLRLCYRSLVETGCGRIADGKLLDTLRRLACFGLTLVRLDLRQESSRHTEALDAITHHLGLGSYAAWSEAERLSFLLRDLECSRARLPAQMATEPEVQDVLDTFEMVAQQPADALGAYIISMTRSASAILAVE